MSAPTLCRRAALLAVAFVALASCHREHATKRPATPPANALLVQRLSVLANGVTLDAAQAAAIATKINGGQLALEAYVDSLLARPETGSYAAVQALVPLVAEFGGMYLTKLGGVHVLKHTDDNIYYLNQPCPRAQTTRVTPWWAPGTTIDVCGDSYRPTVFKVGDKSCSGLYLSSRGYRECGCGPNLVRCYRDWDQVDEVADGVQAEIPDTVAHVVNHDLEIEKLYTSQETVRTKAVEMLYRREQVDATEAPSIESAETWNQDHAWSPRTELYPGMHAGILSTPAFIYMSDDPRSRVRTYYETLWCSTAASVDVNAHDVFALGTVDLRAGDGWQRLAKMPICTGCHARLDYGMQFFRGYPYVYSSRHITASAFTGDRGPLYGDDINDLRGEAVRSPRGFAELAVKQPEFEACIAKRVAEYVFGPDVPPPVVDDIKSALHNTKRLKPALKVALLKYARRPAQLTPAAAFPSGGHHVGKRITVARSTTDLLNGHCTDCHVGTKAERLFADPSTFDESQLLVMLDQVAFEAMPPDGSLQPEDRRAIVHAIVGELWTDPADRLAADAYFTGRRRAFGVQRPQVLNRIVAAQAGAKPPDGVFGALDRVVDAERTQLTPGLATAIGLEALRACKSAGAKTPAQELACLQKATAVDMLVR